MLRILLTYLVPLLLPTVIYFIWANRRARRLAADPEADAAREMVPTPWLLLATAGVVLLALTLGAMALLGGSGIEGEYHPPTFRDGRIEPGHVTPPESAP
ncbi:MAG: hypothetical protein RIE22_08095 [Alphaproteobacteria bacterium]